MSQQPPPSWDPPLQEPPERTIGDMMRVRVRRRRDRIYAEISRNREGGHKVPTWVLAAVLAAVLLGWLYLVVAG